MRPENPLTRASVTLLALTATALPGCSEEDDPYRVGVVVDCVGINRPLHDAELSGAQLPLLQRGADLHGKLPDDGITSIEIGDRDVELVPGCTEVYEFSALTGEVRRLIEREDVDAVIAGGSGPDEIVLRDIARRYPDVVFLPVVHGPREVTLETAAPNLYRFAQDHAQGVAGLGTFAYRDLGWRTAAVVLGNWDTGWAQRDAFAAEFCELGGSVRTDVAVDSFDPAGSDVDSLPMGVDGVAVFAPAFFGPTEFLKALAESADDPAREIVVGPSVTDDPAMLRSTASALAGVRGTSNAEPARTDAFLRDYEAEFPGTPTAVAGSELVTGYRDAMEALLQGLEHADGDEAVVGAELSALQIGLLGGQVRLDESRQAVGSTWLVRINDKAKGSEARSLTPIRETSGVEQSLGGLLPASHAPSDRPPRC